VDVSDILNNLNDAQRKAVTSESPHLLVLAGAGLAEARAVAFSQCEEQGQVKVSAIRRPQ